jgi:hypothetical protein
MAAGLVSLTADYTDSEDEEVGTSGDHDLPDRDETPNSKVVPNKVLNDAGSQENTPVSVR